MAPHTPGARHDDVLARLAQLRASNRPLALVAIPMAVLAVLALAAVVGDLRRAIGGALGLDRALVECGGHADASHKPPDTAALEAKSLTPVVNPFNQWNASKRGEDVYPFMDAWGNIDKSAWVLHPRSTEMYDVKAPDGTEGNDELLKYWAHRAAHFEKLYNETKAKYDGYLLKRSTVRDLERDNQTLEEFAQVAESMKDTIVINGTDVEFRVAEDNDAADCLFRARNDGTIEDVKVFWERCLDVWEKQADALRTKGALAQKQSLEYYSDLDKCETHVRYRCREAEEQLEAAKDSVKGSARENEALERAAKSADAALYRMTNLQLESAMKRREDCMIGKFFWDGVRGNEPALPYLSSPPRRENGTAAMGTSSFDAGLLLEHTKARESSSYSLGTCPTHASVKRGKPLPPDEWTADNDLRCVGPFDPLGIRPKPWGHAKHANRELLPHATWLSLCLENSTTATKGNALSFPPGEAGNPMGPFPVDLKKPELVFGVLASKDEGDDSQVNYLRDTWLGGTLGKPGDERAAASAEKAFGIFLVYTRYKVQEFKRRHGGRRGLLKSRAALNRHQNARLEAEEKAAERRREEPMSFEDDASLDKLAIALKRGVALPEVRPFTEMRGGEADRIARGQAKSASLALASLTFMRYRLDELGCPKWIALIEPTTYTYVRSVAGLLSFLDPDKPIIAGRTRRVEPPKPGAFAPVVKRVVEAPETGDRFDPPGYQRVVSTASGVYLTSEAVRRMTVAVESGLCGDGWPSAAEALSACARVAEVEFVELPGMYDHGPHDVFNATRLEQLGPLYFGGGAQSTMEMDMWKADRIIGLGGNVNDLAEVYEPSAFAGIPGETMARWYQDGFCKDVTGSLRTLEVTKELDSLVRRAPPPPGPPGVDPLPWQMPVDNMG